MFSYKTISTSQTVKFASVIAIAIALVGCSGGPEASQSPTPNASSDVVATPVELPDTPLGEKAGWVVEQLNQEDALAEKDWEKQLSEELTAEMPAEELIGILDDQLRPDAPFVATGFEEQNEYAVVTLSGENDARYYLTIAIEDGQDQISGFHFRPAAS